MPDLRKMTVQSLRKLARKLLGPAGERLRTRAALLEALRGSGDAAAAPARRGRAGVQKPARPARKTPTRSHAAGGEAPPPKKARRRAAGAAGAAGGAPVHPQPRTIEATQEAMEGATDPAGFFVARVRGEDAVREAPHPMAESESDTGARVPEGVPNDPSAEEDLGELPWSYGEDTLAALPRDPRTLFAYWDHAAATVTGALRGLAHPRTQLWVFARAGQGWERIRAAELALESRGYYVHDLEPGRTYRLELHVLGAGGAERMLGPGSNEVTLPPYGPSAAVDDRFVRLPWDQPLGGPLGPGHRGSEFPEGDREALARLSDWTRGGTVVGGSAGAGTPPAGGMGGRPSSPHPASPAPSTSPAGGEGER